ncbi:uncharacterized protein LOC121800637 [Salvia splendens]|uniref:uncharacterized protein LOC121800637 n=1 Tax=Salvia splendens TaxID=180675 RepID=UPI001C253648|nr:uncharacterized protein LOC121800637 [Salvia splendens]
MHKSVFLRIVEADTANDEYFQERRDATGRQSLSSLQKCTGAMRVLVYGTSSDVVDEYLRMSSTVTRDSLIHFVEGVISYFGAIYLRRPTEQDLARLLYVADQCGFSGMIGSIDCMHWEWKNCPNALAGQYTGRSGKPTIILEVVASYDLWIRHAFFGTPGSCNDINVLHRSPVFGDVLEGRAPYVNYVVNGHQYNRAYYLADGIYLHGLHLSSQSLLHKLKSISCLLNSKSLLEKTLSEHLESYKRVSHFCEGHALSGTRC